MPLYGKVVVTDLDGNVYTVGSEERGFRVSLWYGEASTFTMLVSDPNGTFRGRYEAGGKVEVYIDSSDPPSARKFRGVLECPRVQIASPQRLLTLEATDYFYERILGRIVAEVYHEQKAGVIARDLFAKYLPEFNIANVQDTDYTVESKVFPHVSLKEALDWLAKTSGCQYFCDADLNVYFFPKRTRSTGLTVTESMVAAVPESARNLRPVKNSVLVVGGFRLQIDQEQSTVDVNYVTSDVKHYAVKFTPGEIFGKQIQLHLEKVGSPEDLLVRIVEDRSGEPMGPEVANLFFSKGFVGSKTWYPTQARYDFDTAKSYWVAIVKVGDASNHYRVYKATDSPAAAVKESTDGTTWTDPSPAYTLAFRTQYGEPVLSKTVDGVSQTDYKLREVRVNDSTIVDQKTAKRVAFGTLDALRNVHEEVGRLTVKGLTAVPQPGELVKVQLPSLGVDDEFPLDAVHITFQPGKANVTYVQLDVGDPPATVDGVVADLLRDLREERMRDQPVTVLDRVETLAEALSITESLRTKGKRTLSEASSFSDVLTVTEQQTGTFLVGTAKVGFADCA